jgi:hypothetical protein
VQAWGCVSCSAEVGRNTLDSGVSIGTSFPLGRAPGVGPRGGLAFAFSDTPYYNDGVI